MRALKYLFALVLTPIVGYTIVVLLIRMDQSQYRIRFNKLHQKYSSELKSENYDLVNSSEVKNLQQDISKSYFKIAKRIAVPPNLLQSYQQLDRDQTRKALDRVRSAKKALVETHRNLSQSPLFSKLEREVFSKDSFGCISTEYQFLTKCDQFQAGAVFKIYLLEIIIYGIASSNAAKLESSLKKYIEKLNFVAVQKNNLASMLSLQYSLKGLYSTLLLVSEQNDPALNIILAKELANLKINSKAIQSSVFEREIYRGIYLLEKSEFKIFKERGGIGLAKWFSRQMVQPFKILSNPIIKAIDSFASSANLQSLIWDFDETIKSRLTSLDQMKNMSRNREELLQKDVRDSDSVFNYLKYGYNPIGHIMERLDSSSSQQIYRAWLLENYLMEDIQNKLMNLKTSNNAT